jgi:hypothetical protein
VQGRRIVYYVHTKPPLYTYMYVKTNLFKLSWSHKLISGADSLVAANFTCIQCQLDINTGCVQIHNDNRQM